MSIWAAISSTSMEVAFGARSSAVDAIFWEAEVAGIAMPRYMYPLRHVPVRGGLFGSSPWMRMGRFFPDSTTCSWPLVRDVEAMDMKGATAARPWELLDVAGKEHSKRGWCA